MTGAASPRFGVWANVHGTMASPSHPDAPVDASWGRIRDRVRAGLAVAR